MALHFAPASAALLFGFDDCYRSGLQRIQLGQHFIHQRQSVDELCAWREKQHHSYARHRQVLLKLKIAIAGDENIKMLLSHFLQQFAIFESTPAHALHRFAEVARQCAAQSPVKTFVD
jgi:hypothetical protein